MLKDEYDVYLYNDDQNTEVYVIQVLMNVLEIPSQLALTNMKEAQEKGKTLIDFCSKDEAIRKRDLLVSFGLKSQICKGDIDDHKKDD